MQYNFRSDEIIMLGDTHSIHILYEFVRTFPKHSDIISMGDQGLGFGLDKTIAIERTLNMIHLINTHCKENDIVLYLLIGNHDAPYPEIWNSIWSNVILTKSGDTALFPNKKIALLVGGGISVDRCNRKEGIDYWSNEITPFLENIPKCDIMFSHDCPEYFNHSTCSLPIRFQWAIDKDPNLIEDCYKQRYNMSRIVKESKVKEIYSGHFHNSIEETKNDIYYKCLDINEIYYFDANYERTN